MRTYSGAHSLTWWAGVVLGPWMWWVGPVPEGYVPAAFCRLGGGVPLWAFGPLGRMWLSAAAGRRPPWGRVLPRNELAVAL